jgi:apolipoprotein N-acyltransferase
LGVGPLAFAALAPFLHFAVRASRRDGALAGASCGVVYFGLGFWWVPWNVSGTFMAIAFALGVLVLAAPLAALGGLLAHLSHRAGRTAALAAAPGLWAALELLRAEGPLGVPWLRLADALAQWPILIQAGAVGGAALVSAWIVAVNAAIAAALGAARWRTWTAPVALAAGGAVLGAMALPAREAAVSEGLRVAAIQPSIASAHRFDRARFDANLVRLLRLSRDALRASPDLVAWPEGAWERWAVAGGDPFLGAVASSLGTPLLAGVRRAAEPAGVRWNSIALATPDGGTRIAGDKVRPVPVYERAPRSTLARALGGALGWPGRVLPAREPGLVEIRTGRDRDVRVGLLICLDAAYPALARDLRRRGAEVLVSLANEAESGGWSARQHAALVRLRAVETRLPLVRVANTGPSVWVDGWGREIARLEPDRAGAGVAMLAPAGRPAPYVALGNAPVLCLLAFAAWAGIQGGARAVRRQIHRGGSSAPSIEGVHHVR